MPSLMESIVTLDVGAQEPWPNDVKLYQPYAMEQILLPDNANCLAVQAFLHMCGLPFQIEHRANAEFMSPSGKVPFIKCGAFVVSELEPIVQFVANKGITLTEELSADQKSDMRAYMSIIYTVLMNAELYICWCDKKTYNDVTKVRNGSVYPWPLNHFQTWAKKSAVTRKLKVLGWYQKTIESVYQEVENCCQALSERLDGKEYFFGSKPSELDAYLYGHIFAIVSAPEYSHELVTIVMKFPNLMNHCRKICVDYVFNTSIYCSELHNLTNSPSAKNIVDSKSSTAEITPEKNISIVTRYFKLLNSDSDICHSQPSENSSAIKRTDSMTDCSVFDTNQFGDDNSPKAVHRSLSKSDHDYLTNLFNAEKPPPRTEVKYKSRKFTVTSASSIDSGIIKTPKISTSTFGSTLTNVTEEKTEEEIVDDDDDNYTDLTFSSSDENEVEELDEDAKSEKTYTEENIIYQNEISKTSVKDTKIEQSENSHTSIQETKPTELDALVFGHLFTIFTTPLPNSELASIVRNYPPLVNLVKNIEEKYFKRDD